jgi:hypothetical protein
MYAKYIPSIATIRSWRMRTPSPSGWLASAPPTISRRRIGEIATPPGGRLVKETSSKYPLNQPKKDLCLAVRVRTSVRVSTLANEMITAQRSKTSSLNINVR